MKRLFVIIASIVLIMCSLSSCKIEGYGSGYDDGYLDGRETGLDYGYTKGIEEAQRFLAFAVDDDLSDLGRDIEDEYGIHPAEAVELLTNYADNSAEATKEELNNAIWAIYRYYYGLREVVNGIEDYYIE